MDTLKIATFNVNGIQTRLAALLAWLEREAPDIVCLQELKTPDARFPAAALEKAGYGAIWQGQSAWNGVAILARDSQPLEVRRGLPGNASDPHSRYLEAAIDGLLVASLYLPNGNPQPGPKFDYKLAWFEHLIRHAAELMESGHPVVLAGDFNVVPSDFDIYDTRSWKKDALLQPESRECFERLLRQGWVDALRQRFPTGASIPSGTASASTGNATPGCASTTCCSAPAWRTTWKTPGGSLGARRGARQRPRAGLGKPAASLRAPALAELAPALRIGSHRPSGNLATTLISKLKPYSQFTPTAVSVGYGASPQYSGTIFQMRSKLASASTMNTVTSSTSSNPQPAAASTAFRLSKARRTWVSSSGSGEPSSRLPTWPETNSRPSLRTAGE